MKFVLISLIIALAIAFVSADCRPNEYLTTCPPFPECARSCTFPDPPDCENPECDDGERCVCIEDYLTNHIGECVHRTDCDVE